MFGGQMDLASQVGWRVQGSPVALERKPYCHRKMVQQAVHKVSADRKGNGNGNLPRTPVVAAAADDLLPFDDDWRGIGLPGHSHTPFHTQVRL